MRSPNAVTAALALLASLCEVSPEVAWCLATGNAARAHRLEAGFLEVGKPADLVLMGKIAGSVGTDALDGFTAGDIPGISFVIVNGEIVVRLLEHNTGHAAIAVRIGYARAAKFMDRPGHYPNLPVSTATAATEHTRTLCFAPAVSVHG